MKACEIMTPHPRTGTPEMPLKRAATLMRRGHFRHLPIMVERRLHGIVSDRDLQRAVAAGISEDAAIASLVHAPPITALPDTPIEQVAQLMQDNKIGCVPIVTVAQTGDERRAAGDASGSDAGEAPREALVGIVTESDVLDALVRTLASSDPGTRLTLHLDDPAANLGQIARILQTYRVPLQALATEPLPAGDGASGRLRLTLRLGTINPRPLRQALRAAGLTVETAAGEALGGEAPPVGSLAEPVPQRRGGVRLDSAHAPRPGVYVTFEVER